MWFFVIIAIMNRKNEKKCNYCKSSTMIIVSYHKIVPCKLLLFVSYNKWLFYLLSELILFFEETFSWSFFPKLHAYKSMKNSNSYSLCILIRLKQIYSTIYGESAIHIYRLQIWNNSIVVLFESPIIRENSYYLKTRFDLLLRNLSMLLPMPCPQFILNTSYA